MSRKLYHFTPEMHEELAKFYPVTLASELAEKFNCSVRKIYNTAFDMGLKKDPEFVKEIARKNMERTDHPAKKHWRQKGCIPLNKGLKQIDYMTPEGIERSKATRFQKGRLGWNHKPVGYERINVDGYVEVKVAEPRTFKLKQRVVWEKNFGAIPPGHNIQFKDGNPLNCEPENLYCISRSDQLKYENSHIARYPKDIQLAIQAKGVLTRQINKQLKLQENEH
jgi:hypothetical protein